MVAKNPKPLNLLTDMAEKKEAAAREFMDAVAIFRAQNKEMKNGVDRAVSQLKKALIEIDDRLSKHEFILEKVVKLTEYAEDTLLNVLLAIRQNDYLQAWYPAQHDFPDMKVSGPHPAKIIKGEVYGKSKQR